jgi:hypothetical protein
MPHVAPRPSMHHSRSTWPPVVRLVAIGSVAGAAWRGHHGHCAENEVMPPTRGGRWPEPRSDPARSTDRRRPWRPAAVVRPPTPQQHSPTAGQQPPQQHSDGISTRSRRHLKKQLHMGVAHGLGSGHRPGRSACLGSDVRVLLGSSRCADLPPRRGDPF